MKRAAALNKHKIPKQTHKDKIQDLNSSREVVVRGNGVRLGPREWWKPGELSRGVSSRQQMKAFTGAWGSIRLYAS